MSLEIQEDRKIVQPLATETERATSLRKERTLAVEDVAGKWGQWINQAREVTRKLNRG